MVTVGKPELSVTIVSLNRFGACPRECHLQLAVRVIGYVKTVLHKKISIDSQPISFKRDTPDFQVLRPDFLQDCSDTSEETDPNWPSIFGPILQSTFLVDSGHAHD